MFQVWWGISWVKICLVQVRPLHDFAWDLTSHTGGSPQSRSTALPGTVQLSQWNTKRFMSDVRSVATTPTPVAHVHRTPAQLGTKTTPSPIWTAEVWVYPTHRHSDQGSVPVTRTDPGTVFLEQPDRNNPRLDSRTGTEVANALHQFGCSLKPMALC
jgi:hypothetical protein